MKIIIILISLLLITSNVSAIEPFTIKVENESIRNQDIISAGADVVFDFSGPDFTRAGEKIVGFTFKTQLRPNLDLLEETWNETVIINNSLQYTFSYRSIVPKCQFAINGANFNCPFKSQKTTGIGFIDDTIGFFSQGGFIQSNRYIVSAIKCQPLGTCNNLTLISLFSSEKGFTENRFVSEEHIRIQNVSGAPSGSALEKRMMDDGSIFAIDMIMRPNNVNPTTNTTDFSQLKVFSDFIQTDYHNENGFMQISQFKYILSSTNKQVKSTMTYQFRTLNGTKEAESCVEESKQIFFGITLSQSKLEKCESELDRDPGPGLLTELISNLGHLMKEMVVFLFGLTGRTDVRNSVEAFLGGMGFFVFHIISLALANLTLTIGAIFLILFEMGIIANFGSQNYTGMLTPPLLFGLALVGLVIGLITFLINIARWGGTLGVQVWTSIPDIARIFLIGLAISATFIGAATVAG